MHRAWLLVVLAGCGRVGFDALVVGGDAGMDGDGGVTTDACVFDVWGTPQRVAELSSGSAEYGGQITGDGLAYYFRSDRGGGSDLYFARRAMRTDVFGTPMEMPELSSASDDLEISVSDNELEVYFTSDRTTRYCIFHAQRASTAVPFSAITRLDALCPTVPASGPFVTPDGLTMYYTRMDGANYEGTLMVTRRASPAAAFTIGAPIAELVSGTLAKGYPVLSSDGLTLYFDGGVTHHLYEAVRPDATSPFAPERMMTELNSTATDEDVSITADGLEIYFGSGRGGGADDIYRSTRSCR